MPFAIPPLPPVPLPPRPAGGSATAALLADIQGNVLKPHGRDYVRVALLRMPDLPDAAAASVLRTCVRALAPAVTTAATQQAQADQRSGGESEAAFVGLALSSRALRLLQAPAPIDGAGRSDAAFAMGMWARAVGVLRDGDSPGQLRASWEAPYREREPELLLLVAHDREVAVQTQLQVLLGRLPTSVAAGAAIESGAMLWRRRADNGEEERIEHFGFVDGLSNPQFVAPRADEPPIPNKTYFPLQQILAWMPAAGYGSYLVLRKLEQNVDGFRKRAATLAGRLGGGTTPEAAAALFVGRDQHGVPLVAGVTDPTAPFTFAADPQGLRCPFHAHVRKMNPRGSSEGGFAAERGHLFVRRSVPYGERTLTPEGFVTGVDAPSEGVGLLFMGCMASIERQFEHMHTVWIERADFPGTGPTQGVDALVARGGTVELPFPGIVGGAPTANAATCPGMGEYVTPKGGGYFFLPPVISFLRRI